jgi:phosphatidylglycerol lysyltransferase
VSEGRAAVQGARRSATSPFARVAPWLALLPAVILLACSVSSDEVAITGGDPLGMWRILPGGPVAGDWIGAEVSSTAFLLVAIALARGKRSGFWLALAAMGGAVVVQGGQLGHPVAACLAVVVAVILLWSRGRYDVATSRREAVVATGLLAVGALVAMVGALEVANGHDVLGVAVDAVGGLFDLATPVAVPSLTALGAILVIARLGYLAATVLLLDPGRDDRPAVTVAAARATLARVGSGALLPYQLGPDCIPFADSAGTAALAVASAGRTAVAVGDPAGQPEAAEAVLDAWADRCRRLDLMPVVYQASATTVRRLRTLGWHACLVGREAVIDPVGFKLGSSSVANLRHTVTRSRKGGLRVAWSANGLRDFDEPGLAAALADLDERWRRTAGPQLGFTVGRFDAADPGDAAIAVALDETGDPVAFVVLRPTGMDGGWMLDLMRRSRTTVPGAVEACLVGAIEGLAAMGVRRLSLGLAPLAGLSRDDGPAQERALAIGARAVRPVYDYNGLAFFKNKFAPEWEPRYLAVRSRWHFTAAAIALLRLHLGGSWPRVIRSVAAGLVPAR